MKKKCFKCNQIKDLDDFYKHAAMSGGYLNKCKECTRNDSTKNREKNIDRVRAYDRNRPNKKERSIKNYLNLKDNREKIPGFSKPHIAVRRAIKSGILVKPKTCERCLTEKDIIAHHDDYSKNLDIKWLCEVCHRARHKELGWGIPRNPSRKKPLETR